MEGRRVKRMCRELWREWKEGKGGVYTVERERGVDGGESGTPRVLRRCEGREWWEGKVEVK